MRRVLPRRQVDRALQPRRLRGPEQVERVAARVDDDEALRRLAQRLDQRRVLRLSGELEAGPAQRPRQPRRLGRELHRLLEAAGKARRRQRRLRRRAQHHRGPVVPRQLLQRGDAGAQQRPRDGLRLVEDQHRTRQIVELAAARGARGEQALEELDVGRDDHRRRPVLHRQLQLVPSLPVLHRLLVESRMVRQRDALAQHALEHLHRLVDDRGEGDGVDDAPQPVAAGVVEREAERGERLAAAGRHGQGEHAGRLRGLRPDMRQHLGADRADAASPPGGEARHMRLVAREELGQQGLERRPVPIALPAFGAVVEGLRRQEVGVDQAGEQHPAEQAELEAGFSGVDPEALRHEPAKWRIELLPPHRVRLREIALQPLVERDLAAEAVRQPRMMSGDRIGDELGQQPVSRRLDEVESEASAGGRVVRAANVPEPALEGLGVFPDVMKGRGELGGGLKRQRRSHGPGEAGGPAQVFLQRLPAGLVRCLGRVSEVHRARRAPIRVLHRSLPRMRAGANGHPHARDGRPP